MKLWAYVQDHDFSIPVQRGSALHFTSSHSLLGSLITLVDAL